MKWFRDQAYYDSAGWRGTWALDGGGALMNQSVHTVDALLYLAGPIKAVQAVTACLAHERIEVEDIIVATVEFESGALGVIECSTCTWSKDGHPARVQLAGTDGSVFLADESFELWDFREEKPEDAEISKTLMRGQETWRERSFGDQFLPTPTEFRGSGASHHRRPPMHHPCW